MRSYPVLAFFAFASPTFHVNGHPLIDDIDPYAVDKLKYLDKLPEWKSDVMERLNVGFVDAWELAKFAILELEDRDPDHDPKHPKPPSLIFKKYFLPNDHDAVLAVFKSIVTPNYRGNDRLKEVYFSNIDPAGECDIPSPDGEVKAGSVGMYTTPNTLHEEERPSFIHVCPDIWTLGYPKSIHDIKCEDTCEDLKHNKCWPSARMATVAEVILHELVHRTSYTKERPQGLLFPIIDQVMKDPKGGKDEHGNPKQVQVYGTYYTQQLLHIEKNKARYNADSYAMFARDAYWSYLCHSKKINYGSPPHWETNIPNKLKPKPPAMQVQLAGDL
ncbi:hypothetical protein B0T14DRAFT_571812 [Immersiella caudata]|uniref:Lysine-specific metallo-endopeptidase domain-containing protein n=1 Tax=Immersiella caudata TaxID=314043 RepID=A0AA39WBB9_9PEZI|nr:hypothetical protein B0T14DRAFT_571812 [Immersiella caudata]